MKKERVWTFPRKISTLTQPCRRGILTRPQVGDFEVAIAVFTLGINNGLRIGDLLKLRVFQVKELQPGETVTIIEEKTGKKNVVMINKEVRRALAVYLDSVKAADSDFLFKSRIGSNKALNKSYVNSLIKT